jgi:hypothetical protein
MTGGENGGWDEVQEPFVLPIPAKPEMAADETGEAAR